MKAVLGWMREFAPLDAPLDTLARRLVETGTEVDEVRSAADGVIVVRVTGLVPVPESTKGVQFVDLDTGAGPVRVLTAAQNLTVGDLVPWAPPGARLPGWDEPLRAREMFGGKYVSPGMLCASTELGIAGDEDGILLLDGGVPGQPIQEILDLDVVFDVEVTPNRPDCLSQAGIARELAAALGEPFREPTAVLPGSVGVPDSMGVPESADSLDLAASPDSASRRTSEMRALEPAQPIEDIQIVIENPADCPRFVAVVIDGLAVGPSPEWMQRRLALIEGRPINNVVDVTNYVAHELGQPMHAFDLDRFLAAQGGGSAANLVVRRGRGGERIRCLDNIEREVDDDDVLVCAGDCPASIAGVIGGADTAVTETTTRILLEAASWDPTRVRATSRQRNVRTDASTLFEKGLTDTLPRSAMLRAMELIRRHAGGTSGSISDRWAQPLPPPETLSITAGFIKARLGYSAGIDQTTTALERLGFVVARGVAEELRVTPPPHRRDVTIAEDLVEEVGRALGYDRAPSTLPGRRAPVTSLASDVPIDDRVRDFCTAAGFDEAITYSFTSATQVSALPGLGGTRVPIALTNPLSEEWSVMRISLLPGLCAALAGNVNRGVDGISLFEIGCAYWDEERTEPPLGATRDGADSALPPLPAEPLILATSAHIVRATHAPETDADAAARALNHARALLDRVAHDLAGVRLSTEPAVIAGLHPTRAAHILVDGRAVGLLGELSPETAERLALRGRVVVAEIQIDAVVPVPPRPLRYRQPARFPAVIQDLAVVVERHERADRALTAIAEAGGPLLESAELYDEYRDARVGEGHKGWTFRLTYRALDRTLTGDEIQPVQARIAAELAARCDAAIRG